jgi:hypothetical protein
MLISMTRILYKILFLKFLILISNHCSLFASENYRGKEFHYVQDTLYDHQLLFNGRVWKSRYGQVLNHEFFITKNWIPGEVTINKKNFSRVMLKYDLFNDELLAMVNPGTVVILSTEKVESFTMKIDPEPFRFINYNFANSPLIKGYGQLLYNGITSLIVKYNKQIKLLAVENKYDEFYQKQQVLIMCNGQFNRIKSKKDLFNLFGDHREEIQKYIREKGLAITLSKPESLIPILQFYDSLIQGR